MTYLYHSHQNCRWIECCLSIIITNSVTASIGHKFQWKSFKILKNVLMSCLKLNACELNRPIEFRIQNSEKFGNYCWSLLVTNQNSEHCLLLYDSTETACLLTAKLRQYWTQYRKTQIFCWDWQMNNWRVSKIFVFVYVFYISVHPRLVIVFLLTLPFVTHVAHIWYICIHSNSVYANSFVLALLDQTIWKQFV